MAYQALMRRVPMGTTASHHDVNAGPGAWLDVLEVAGTVAYDARGRECRWDVHADLGANAMLTWQGEPLVVSEGAVVRKSVTLRLAEGAAVCLRDSIVLGRHGAASGQLRAPTTVGYDSQPLFVESLVLPSPEPRPGVVGAARVIDSVLVAGVRVETSADPSVLQLAGPGTLFRFLGLEMNRSPLGQRWDQGAETVRTSWQSHPNRAVGALT